MQAVLTHLRLAEADPGESLRSTSLVWDFALLAFAFFDSLGVAADSVALGISDVVVWSGSSSRFGEGSISSETLASQRAKKLPDLRKTVGGFHISNENSFAWRMVDIDDGILPKH